MADDLDREVRAELRALPRTQADTVARHLVVAGRLLDDDPVEALAHARAARRLAARVAAVREAVGLAAYHAGEWHTAISELRAYHRISGRLTHLAVVADCERALGRPERALDLHRTAPNDQLTPVEATELLIVAAGARTDLGQPDAAVTMLDVPELAAAEPAPWVARLRYAYADALLAMGRPDGAREWFARAAVADEEGETGAAERLLDLDGVVLEPAEDEQPDAAEGGSAETALTVESGSAATGEDARSAGTGSVETFDTIDVGEPEAEAAEAGETVDAGPARIVAAGAAAGPVETIGSDETGETDEASETGNTGETGVAVEPMTASGRLVDAYDLIILDLDGVVYVGEKPVPAAVEAIAALRAEGRPLAYATNNASRGAAEVAAHLGQLGIEATPADVVTSAAVAADALALRLDPGTAVLVVGTEALAGEVRRVGFRPVRSADERPGAVVQGYGPEVGWAALAEASLAIQAGAVWVVTNADQTLPSQRGILPGNGSLVAALRTALGRDPDLVVGKPEPAFFTAVAARAGSHKPLVVGDRLDTDIEGANRAGMDSLLVLTGVADMQQARAAAPEQRPTHLGHDLAALHAPGQALD